MTARISRCSKGIRGSCESTIAAASILPASFVLLAQRPASSPLTFKRLRDASAESQNWLMYWGNYQGTHYSSLKQIDKSNVDRLQTSWMMPMSGVASLQATPLVADGVMYTSGVPGTIYALDAGTGAQIWKYERTPKARTTGLLLWEPQVADAMASAPMSYSVYGKQFIGVMAGPTLFSLSLP